MEIKELLSKKKYFIFDLDGTLVDLEDLNYNSFKNVVQKHFNVEFTYAMYLKHFAGIGSKKGFIGLLNEYGTQSKSDDLIKEWQEEYRATKRYQLQNNFDENVKLVDGAKEFIKSLKEKGMKVALGTSSAKEFTMIIIEKLGILEYFDSVVTVNDVKNTKPDPETFLTALKNIGGNIDEAVIFEDSPNGIICAKNSGIDYIVVHIKGRNDESSKNSPYTIQSFKELL